MPIEKAVSLYIVYLYAVRDPQAAGKAHALRHFLDTCSPGAEVHHELFAVYADYIEGLIETLPHGVRRKRRAAQGAITCDLWVWLVEQDVLSTQDHEPLPTPRVYPN